MRTSFAILKTALALPLLLVFLILSIPAALLFGVFWVVTIFLELLGFGKSADAILENLVAPLREY